MFLFIVPLACCGTKTTDIETEEVPVDYGGAVTVAQDEFNRIFSEFVNLKMYIFWMLKSPNTYTFAYFKNRLGKFRVKY